MDIESNLGAEGDLGIQVTRAEPVIVDREVEDGWKLRKMFDEGIWYAIVMRPSGHYVQAVHCESEEKADEWLAWAEPKLREELAERREDA